MIKGIIFDLKRYAIHDGPGIRTTVFMKGCPLNCQWCANPESQQSRREFIFRPDLCLHCDACVQACPHGAVISRATGKAIDLESCDYCGACVQECYAEALQMVGRSVSVAELLAEIEKDTPFYSQSGGGVTFSGGEPLAQPDFLEAILRACRQNDLHTTVDTCGFAPWETIDRLRGQVDLFLYDLKLLDDRQHRRVTGVSNATILSNLEKLAAEQAVIVRIPLIPGINADGDRLRRMGTYLCDRTPVRKVDLLPYHRMAVSKYERLTRRYAILDLDPPSDEEIQAAVKTLEAFGLKVTVGG